MKAAAAILMLFVANCSVAQTLTNQLPIADSVKVTAVYSTIAVAPAPEKGESKAGIRADEVSLHLETGRKYKAIEMEFPASAEILASGRNVKQEKNELEWVWSLATGESVALMLVTAADSAAGTRLFSGYVRRTGTEAWKLIGTVRVKDSLRSIRQAIQFMEDGPADKPVFLDAWLQRRNGTWLQAGGTAGTKAPLSSALQNLDTLAQAKKEAQFIKRYTSRDKGNSWQSVQGLYYTILTQGTGKQVQLSDTVTVHYKGSLLSNGAVFDQTKDKPATFPLNRLIRGWQIGVPLLQSGGKIRLIIPSGLAYGIRTRSPAIPPNSVLVFDIEVVAAKEASSK